MLAWQRFALVPLARSAAEVLVSGLLPPSFFHGDPLCLSSLDAWL